MPTVSRHGSEDMKVREQIENEARPNDVGRERLPYEPPRITRKRSLERAILFSGTVTTGTATTGTSAQGLTADG
jgi:hypothetical protein